MTLLLSEKHLAAADGRCLNSAAPQLQKSEVWVDWDESYPEKIYECIFCLSREYLTYNFVKGNAIKPKGSQLMREVFDIQSMFQQVW